MRSHVISSEAKPLQSIGGGVAHGGIAVHTRALNGRKDIRSSKSNHAQGLDGHETDHRTAVLDRGD
jgi:hypothetical protein